MTGIKQSNSKTPTYPKESWESEVKKGSEREIEGRISNILRKVLRGGKLGIVGPEGFKKGSVMIYGGTWRGVLRGIEAGGEEGIVDDVIGGTVLDIVDGIVGVAAVIREGGGAVGIVARAVDRTVE